MSYYRVAAFHALNRSQFNKIESIAIHYDWNLAFSGKSLGNAHLARTVSITKHLWEMVHSKDDPEKDVKIKIELDVAIAGALLHDIGLVEGNKGHCFAGKKIAKQLLSEIEISDDIASAILHCIEAHDGEVAAQSEAAKLVHDADTIDKLGPLGVIRHIWKLSLLGEPDMEPKLLSEIVSEHLKTRFENLYLPQSRKVAEELIDAQAKMFELPDAFHKLVDFIYQSSASGIPVDRMLPDLIKSIQLDSDVIEVLNKQIDLGIIE
ncbi:MAG: HD domain-containing protein [Thermoplasmata archaeon]|nr:MAG: HD domain-containing protein [Thermoplasmata archaeon]